MSPPQVSSDGPAGDRVILDPNKIPPSRNPSRIKRVFRRLAGKDPESKLPPSTIPLTERNLTELFNPDYNDEHDAFHKVRGPRKISIPEWIQLLP
jgi:hypothetical protein